MGSVAAENDRNIRTLFKTNFLNILILLLSFSSVLADIFIGLTLIVEYYFDGKKSWSVITFSLIFFPSVIIHVLSIKFLTVNKNAKPVHWYFHYFLLGIFYRYLEVVRNYMTVYRSKDELKLNSTNLDINDLNQLYLIKSFLECAPQLVFQFYVLIVSPIWLFSTVFSAVVSVVSIACALAIHTEIKGENIFPGVILFVLWRIGMITARISALVLCTYICGPWIILFIGAHWLGMTFWIIYQQTVFGDSGTEGALYASVFGVVNCFCTFTLKNDLSRWSAIVLNAILFFENLICLAVFLLRFAEKSPKLAVVSFVTVVFGDILGMLSFLLYNSFCHPDETLKCKFSLTGVRCQKSIQRPLSKDNYFYTLKKKRRIEEKKSDSTAVNHNDEHHQNIHSPCSSSIVIFEESHCSDLKCDEEPLHISVLKNVNDICKNEVFLQMEKKLEPLKLSAALKRRAICSSIDLSRFVENSIENDLEIESGKRLKAAELDETEDKCPHNVSISEDNIDDSTLRNTAVIERLIDNDVAVTTNEEHRLELDCGSLSVVQGKLLLECDVEINRRHIDISLPSSPPVQFGEREPLRNTDETKAKRSCESILVATIDKICWSSSRNHSVSADNYGATSQIPDKNNRKKGEPKKVKINLDINKFIELEHLSGWERPVLRDGNGTSSFKMERNNRCTVQILKETINESDKENIPVHKH